MHHEKICEKVKCVLGLNRMRCQDVLVHDLFSWWDLIESVCIMWGEKRLLPMALHQVVCL
jgi:hypothetical protein